ncbi:hypothetical protein Q5P01_013009 [Channa striata]|uniref:Uncharacterized protein n=1 Tax=Channa striata TaxID=64152 RepID=A0AA88MSV3_CHASR|nr:hypothetical protein Q5P01_013009 [Channa striata]
MVLQRRPVDRSPFGQNKNVTKCVDHQDGEDRTPQSHVSEADMQRLAQPRVFSCPSCQSHRAVSVCGSSAGRRRGDAGNQRVESEGKRRAAVILAENLGCESVCALIPGLELRLNEQVGVLVGLSQLAREHGDPH